MDKQTLNTVSQLVAENTIPKANKGESFDDFVKRVYPKFEDSVKNSSNSVVSEIESDSKDALRNAISKLEVRRIIVKQFCRVNDPFDIEPPKEATVDEILEHNGVEGSPEDLKKIMGESAFSDYIDRLKTPKKDGLTQTEIKQKRIEHYAKYTPCYPSEKSYSHGSGGTTRGYHWQSDLQEEFLKDHINFLDAYGLDDSFPEIKESEEQDEPAEGENTNDSKDSK